MDYLPNPDRSYVLAISGGVDSMTLLQLFSKHVPAKQLIIGHFDHRTRSSSSKDLKFIKARAKKLKIKFVSGSREGKKTSEEHLRNERRAFLEKVLKENAFDHIVTAHHLDDQLETFFMRLLRGTGLHGLRGMRPKNGVWLKPLLNISKQEILVYAKKENIKFQNDPTNQTNIYYRNRIRNELLPVLDQLSESYGGPEKMRKRFAALLKEIPREKIPAHAFQKTSLWWKANRKLTPQTLRHVFKNLGTEIPSRERLAEALNEINSGKKSADLPGKIRFTRSCGSLYFQNPEQRKALQTLKFERKAGKHFCEPLGLSFGEFPLHWQEAELRFFQDGDRLQGKKLKEVFLKQRISSLERRAVPVAARRNTHEVLWHFGMPGWNALPKVKESSQISENR